MKIKQTHKQILYMSMTFLWIIVIFSFSLQSGDESGQLSGGIVSWIVESFSLTKFMDIDTIHFLVRKTAHFTEYFILGILTLLTLLQTKFLKKEVVAVFFCIIIASLDETIQLFVGGRAGQLMDVVLDSSGSFSAVLLLYLYRSFRVTIVKMKG